MGDLKEDALYLDVYSLGIVNMSVCAPKWWSKSKVMDEANRLHPTGIKSKRWFISIMKVFKGGEPMPCDCEEDPTRQHWLLNC